MKTWFVLLYKIDNRENIGSFLVRGETLLHAMARAYYNRNKYYPGYEVKEVKMIE